MPPYFRGSREAEGVIVLVDGAADGAEAVVAVGHGIGDGELLEARGLGGLNDAHKGDVVGDQRVKFQPELVRIGAFVVGTEDRVGNGLLPRILRRSKPLGLVGPNELPVGEVRPPGMVCNHRNTSISVIVHSLPQEYGKVNPKRGFLPPPNAIGQRAHP